MVIISNLYGGRGSLRPRRLELQISWFAIGSHLKTVLGGRRMHVKLVVVLRRDPVLLGKTGKAEICWLVATVALLTPRLALMLGCQVSINCGFEGRFPF